MLCTLNEIQLNIISVSVSSEDFPRCSSVETGINGCNKVCEKDGRMNLNQQWNTPEVTELALNSILKSLCVVPI
jgi:hypothetical protein